MLQSPKVSAVLFAVISLTVLFTGCKKEGDADVKPGIPKIKTISFYDNWLMATRTETYAYDSQGRITSETTTYSNGSPSKVTTFSYKTDSVTLTYPNLDPLTYPLNSNGYVTYFIDGDQSYDSEGHVVSSDLYTITWNNGNLIEIYDKQASKTEKSFTYTDKTNTIGNANKGITFLGKNSKNLIQSTTVQNGTTYQHSYEFDSEGRVTKMTGEYGTTYTYTYM